MPRCSRVRDNMTAWLDGELSPRWTLRVENHVGRCTACAVEAQSLRHTLASQHILLPQLLRGDVVPREQFRADRILADLHRAMAADDVPAAQRWNWGSVDWTWWLRPIPVAVAAAAIIVITLVEVAGGPEDILVPLGVQAPPPVVSKKPGMFRDYAIIERLDALENFDTVDVEPLDDDQSAEQG